MNIANDNSHGYDRQYRWGPDYDCSSLVISAFRYAGFNVGNATYTGNMRSNFTANGFTWIPWSQIANTSNLQRGDILLNEVNHTEIYLGNNQTVGAHCNENNGISGGLTGDQTGTEISVTPYGYQNWDGVLRFNGQEYNSPAFLSVTPGSDSAETSFSWTKSANAVCFTVRIFSGELWSGEEVGTVWNLENNKYSIKLPIGHYCAYVDTVYKDNSYLMSNVVEFDVSAQLPVDAVATNLGVKPANAKYPTKFFWDSVNGAIAYTIRIYNGTVWEAPEVGTAWNLTGTYYEYILPAGHYSAYIDTVFENNSYIMSNVVEFDVANYTEGSNEPSILSVTPGKDHEPTKFSWTATKNNIAYTLRIYNGDVWKSEEIGSKWNMTETSCLVNLPKGHYSAYIDTVFNNDTYEMSNLVSFDVVDSTPSEPFPMISKKDFLSNEKVRIEWAETLNTDS